MERLRGGVLPLRTGKVTGLFEQIAQPVMHARGGWAGRRPPAAAGRGASAELIQGTIGKNKRPPQTPWDGLSFTDVTTLPKLTEQRRDRRRGSEKCSKDSEHWI
jgi:hypothetical protein